MAMKYKVEGANQIRVSINKLSISMRKRVQKACNEGAQVIANKAKSIASLGPTGNLKKAIYAKDMPYKKWSPPVAIATVDRHIAPHSHLVEFGTSGVRRHKSGKSTGQMSARPFLRPALDASRGEVKKIIENAMKKSIDKAGIK